MKTNIAKTKCLNFIMMRTIRKSIRIKIKSVSGQRVMTRPKSRERNNTKQKRLILKNRRISGQININNLTDKVCDTMHS